LSGLVAPIVVGALFAFLFRPIKDRFKIPWLPHELQVLCSFAAIGLVLFFAFDTARQYIPDDKQQLEYKIRLKYKLNEKYQQLVMKSPKENPSMLMSFIQKQTDPLMDKVNQLLELDRKETEQFLHHRSGHFGGDNKILGYFEANQNTRKYVAPEEAPTAAPATTATVAAPVEPPATREGSSWEPWILAPLIFIFLGFDNGQIRRYFISLVPNRYFELSLTLLDRLDNAIGKYLRGTLMECNFSWSYSMSRVDFAWVSCRDRDSDWLSLRTGYCHSDAGNGHRPGDLSRLRLNRGKPRAADSWTGPEQSAALRGDFGWDHSCIGRCCISAFCPR
jgi:hypothetical protein